MGGPGGGNGGVLTDAHDATHESSDADRVGEDAGESGGVGVGKTRVRMEGSWCTSKSENDRSDFSESALCADGCDVVVGGVDDRTADDDESQHGGDGDHGDDGDYTVMAIEAYKAEW